MKVCISSSCKFEKDWGKLKDDLSDLSAVFIFPEVQCLEDLSDKAVDEEMEHTVSRYFNELNDANTLYVYCPGGYIGKGVASEIGYSIAMGKEVISSENIADIGIRSMAKKVMNPADFKKYLRSKCNV